MNDLVQQFNCSYQALYIGESFLNYTYDFYRNYWILDAGLNNMYIFIAPKFNFDIEILKDY